MKTAAKEEKSVQYNNIVRTVKCVCRFLFVGKPCQYVYNIPQTSYRLTKSCIIISHMERDVAKNPIRKMVVYVSIRSFRLHDNINNNKTDPLIASEHEPFIYTINNNSNLHF